MFACFYVSMHSYICMYCIYLCSVCMHAFMCVSIHYFNDKENSTGHNLRPRPHSCALFSKDPRTLYGALLKCPQNSIPTYLYTYGLLSFLACVSFILVSFS